jgi:hypothetical protein
MPSGLAEALLAQGRLAAQQWDTLGQTFGAIPQRLQQEQTTQQEQQLREFQLREAQRHEADINAYDAALKNPKNYNPDGSSNDDMIVAQLRQTSPQAAMQFQQASLGLKQAKANYDDTIARTNASNAQAADRNLAIQNAQRDYIGSAAYNAKDLIAQNPLQGRDIVMGHIARALADSQTKGSVPIVNEQDARAFLGQLASVGPEQLPTVLQGFIPPELQAKLDQEKATTKKSAAEAALAEMKAKPPNPAQYQAQIDAAVPPNSESPAFQNMRSVALARVRNARTVEDADKAIDELSRQVGQIYVAQAQIPSKLAAQGAMIAPMSREEALKDLSAERIASYKLAPLTAYALARPAGQALMQKVFIINPSYDAKLWDKAKDLNLKYSTGPEGQQLNALNTAILHMDLLADASDALKNGTFVPGNAVYNAFTTVFGKPQRNSLEQIKEFLDGEVGAVVKKGGVTEGEMNRQALRGGSSSSHDQLTTYINNAMRILGGKATVLDDKYHAVMGAMDPWKAISPRAAAVLVKHGFNPDDLTAPPTPAGSFKVGGFTLTPRKD